MCKIVWEINEVKDMIITEIRKDAPKVYDKFQSRIDIAMHLMMGIWIDVGKSGMKYVILNEVKEMTADFYYLLLM
jgi:hypothetical protein